MALLNNKGSFWLKKTLILLVFFTSAQVSLAQKRLPSNFCISPQEKALFDKINQVRKLYNKKPVKLSASLSYVAKTHVEDLLKNSPDTSVCNLSSWSDKGNWAACCYNPYVLKQDCMWDKPKELTPYPYRGYEIAGYFEEDYTVDSVLKFWMGEKEVVNMLITEGEYSDKDWVCAGVGMNKQYVSVWFGQRADGAGAPEICSSKPADELVPIAAADTLQHTHYYLIIASYNNINDARDAVKKYRKAGFESAGTLKNGESTRVFLAHFNEMKEAMMAKQNLPAEYHEAWILKE